MHFRQTYNNAPTKLCVLDIETLAPEAPSGGFPPWPTHRPIVASLLVADQAAYGQWQFAIESVEFGDEAVAIRRIDELLEGRRAVSFNGKGFDFPVLSLTATRLLVERINVDAVADAAIPGWPRGPDKAHVSPVMADEVSCYGPLNSLFRRITGKSRQLPKNPKKATLSRSRNRKSLSILPVLRRLLCRFPC
jgi:Predicted 3'-5' exonuclease related to the exonuclease domain of PolB